MPRKSAAKTVEGVDLSTLDSGTYSIPGVGLVINGELFDSDDPDAVAAYHAQDAKSVEQATEAMAERDAVIVAAVTEPAADENQE